MSVLIEAISVIVRNATLDACYPGGVSGYAADCPMQILLILSYLP